jgi:hypothetical protein
MSKDLDDALIEQDVALENLILLLIPSPNRRVSNESWASSFDETVRLGALVEVGRWARSGMEHLTFLKYLLSIEGKLDGLSAE